jgi:EXLDI family protein
MPNKTIYVADSDLPLIEKAQVLAGGNLSAAIAQALRRYVAEMEPDSGEIIVAVTEDGVRTKKRFRGRLIALQRAKTPDRGRNITTRVYRTEKGRLVIWRRASSNWGQTNWDDPVTWDEDWWRGESQLEIYETLADLQSHITETLYSQVARILQTNSDIEDLDI